MYVAGIPVSRPISPAPCSRAATTRSTASSSPRPSPLPPSTGVPPSVQALFAASKLATRKSPRVLLEDGEIECAQVVLAMGPWSRQAENWLNTYIPVDPLKGEILRMRLQGDPLEYDVSGGGASIYSKPDGLAWCGTTEDWRGFDRQPLPETRDRILAGVKAYPACHRRRRTRDAHRLPAPRDPPTGCPSSARPAGCDNAWLATGAGKKGILLAPAFGKAVADLITMSETDLSISGYSPGRFAAP